MSNFTFLVSSQRAVWILVSSKKLAMCFAFRIEDVSNAVTTAKNTVELTNHIPATCTTFQIIF
jgi:hypothetical protein